MRSWFFFLMIAVPGIAGAESWALIGLRDADGPPIAGELERTRRIFSERMPEGDRMLTGEEIARALGLPSGPVPDPEGALAEAELLFFQLEYAAAEKRLEEAIDTVARGFVDFTPELGRSLRLLLAHILLQHPGGREKAEAILRPLASFASLPESVRRTVGAEVASLWDEVRAAAATRAEGWLVVDCTGCHGGEVWVEGLSVGTTQQSIGMAPGTYRLVLRGLAGSEGKRSLPREVRILPGDETRVHIDLAAEASLVGDGGPALVDEGAVSFERASYLAERLGVDRLLVWRFSPAAVEVREAGPSGPREAWFRERGDEAIEESLRNLVASILERPAGPEVEESFTPADPRLFVRHEDGGGWKPVARWSALGATVVMAGIAGWLSVDAASARAELTRLEAGGRSYTSLQEARRAEELAGMIEARQNWSTVLWTGAAVGGVGTLLLFLDALGEAE